MDCRTCGIALPDNEKAAYHVVCEDCWAETARRSLGQTPYLGLPWERLQQAREQTRQLHGGIRH